MSSLIAIVEDDDTLRVAIDDLLRSCGYSTSGYSSAESLIAADVLPECAAMDGMDGIDLKVPIDEQAPGASVATARAEKHLLRRASATFPFRLQPFDPDVLIDCVDRAIGEGGRP